MNSEFENLRQAFVTRFDTELAKCFVSNDILLHEAMNYSLMSGGKRLRPFICHYVAQILDPGSTSVAMQVGKAIEIAHTYSLIHDDLPSMDNDDYRRGMLTCHKRFDEATAILAGDSLLTYSFEVLSNLDLKSDLKIHLINRFAKALGSDGMAGGQSLDMLSSTLDLNSFLEMCRKKTAALFGFTVSAACIITNHMHLEQELYKFGIYFGMAFQLIDDLKDKDDGASNILGFLSEHQVLAMIEDYIADMKRLSVVVDCPKILHIAEFLEPYVRIST